MPVKKAPSFEDVPQNAARDQNFNVRGKMISISIWKIIIFILLVLTVKSTIDAYQQST